MSKRLLIVSELYYPEETSTGYFVTGIAEGLAMKGGYQVEVVCAQPTYRMRGVSAPARESRAGVLIERLKGPKADKNKLLGRAWLLLSLTFRFAWHLLRKIKKGDTVLVLTNPPTLPLLVTLIAGLKQARPSLLVHDVYPDVLVPTGLMQADSFLYRVIDGGQRWMLNRMAGIVVLGRDMRTRISKKLHSDHAKLAIIPNWGDSERIRPEKKEDNPLRRKLELEDVFVVQFSGNLGRTHGLEDLIALADSWKGREDVIFLVFGWGAGRGWLESEIKRRQLTNMRVLDACSREELPVYLTACDLFLLPFKPGMEGISVPSRLYNVLAAGSPLLGVCSASSELAQVIQEEQVGWVVEPGDIQAMSKAVETARSDKYALREMSRRARRVAEERYTREAVVVQFQNFFRQLSSG